MRGKQSGLKFTSKYLVICGDGLLAIGVIGAASDWVFSDRVSELGFNVIISTYILVTAIGMCAAFLGKALLAIEARIARLENRPQ